MAEEFVCAVNEVDDHEGEDSETEVQTRVGDKLGR